MVSFLNGLLLSLFFPLFAFDTQAGIVRIDALQDERRVGPKQMGMQELVKEAEGYEKEGQNGRAAEIWRKLMGEDPSNFYYPYKLGRIYAAQKNYVDAEGYYRRSLELAPDNVDTKVVLGYALLATERTEEAEKLFTEVVAASPGYQDARQGLENIAKIYAAREEVLVNPPPRFTPQEEELIALAKRYHEELRYKQATAVWKALYCANPDESVFAFSLGEAYYWQSKYRQAEEYLQGALALEPDMEEAKYRLAGVYLAQGYRSVALALYCSLLSDRPDNTDYLEAYARALRANNEFTKARGLYEQRIRGGKNYYDLFNQYHQVLLFTSPSITGQMLYAQERETDIISRLLAAQRNTTLAIGKYAFPLTDTVRIEAMVNGGTVRELNLVAGLNNLFLKTQDYALSASWLLHPQWTIRGAADVQIGRDIGDPLYPIGHEVRFLPAGSLSYNSPTHFIYLSAVLDTLVIKDFNTSPLKGDLLRRDTYLLQDDILLFNRYLKIGGQGFLRYYHDFDDNRQWQGAIWGEVGFPKYRPLLSVRYYGFVGGFKTNRTVYYSYKRQWQHALFAIFSKKTALNMEIDIALEQAWQWSRKLNQPVNTLVFVDKLFRSYDKVYFEIKHIYRPKTQFNFRTTSYWDSTKYTAWDVSGTLNHIF
ncbi:MAG: tetratricopeptide repeat protein [Chlamydiales bacterium]